MRYLIITSMLWITACGDSSKKDAELLNEASLLHNEAVAIASDIQAHLNQLESDSTISVDSLKVWKQLLTQWNEELVEIPGNDHEHDHCDGHDHDHDHHHHQPADQVTAAEMLLIQRDMKERIEQISYRIKK